MKQNEFKTIVIAAEDGKYLTQSSEVELSERVVASTIALGKYDNVDNWKEITKEEGDEIRKQQEEARKAEKAAAKSFRLKNLIQKKLFYIKIR